MRDITKRKADMISTTATMDLAVAKRDNLRAVTQAIGLRIADRDRKVLALVDEDASQSVARALFQEPDGPLVDRASIRELKEAGEVDNRARQIAAKQQAAAEIAAAGTINDQLKASRAFADEVGVQPALAAVVEWLGSGQALLAALMGADIASRIDLHPNGAANVIGENGGPAAHLVRGLMNLRWDAHPYSLKPTWLNAIPEQHPYKMAGVARARGALLAQVEDASR